MFKQKPFPFSLIILGILITLHVLASLYSWYWQYPWLDFVVHIFSGLWVASVILWLVSCFGQINSLKEYKIRSFLIAFFSAVFLGILWEILENVSQVTYVNSEIYNLNMATDLLGDIIGGILAYLYFIKRRKQVDIHPDILHPFYNQTGVTKS